MLTPITARDWIALFVISALGIAALAALLPLSARMPFITPPETYNAFHPIKKPFASLMNFTAVAVGIADVTVCLMLYGAWMSWSLSHPASKRDPQRDDRR